MLRQLQKMRSSSEVVSLRWGRCRWKQGMQYVVRPESCLVEQLIFRVIAQVTEHRCIRSAVSKASSAVDHWVDALTLWRLGETMPCAGCVRETSDDSRAIYVLVVPHDQQIWSLYSLRRYLRETKMGVGHLKAQISRGIGVAHHRLLTTQYSLGYHVALFAWSYVKPFWYNTGVWQTDTHTHTHTHRQTDRHTMIHAHR